MQSTTSSTRTFQTQPTKEEPKPPRRHLKLPKVSLRLPWVLVIVLVIFSIFMYAQYKDAKNKVETSAPSSNSSQVNQTIAAVQKLIIVPTNETPTVATVSDVAKLKNLAFFTNARNGDKIVVYDKAKEAILYRPSTNQLVNVAPVSESPSTSK